MIMMNKKLQLIMLSMITGVNTATRCFCQCHASANIILTTPKKRTEATVDR